MQCGIVKTFVMQNSTADCSLHPTRRDIGWQVRRGESVSLLITRNCLRLPFCTPSISRGFYNEGLAINALRQPERQYPTINHARRHFTIFYVSHSIPLCQSWLNGLFYCSRMQVPDNGGLIYEPTKHLRSMNGALTTYKMATDTCH